MAGYTADNSLTRTVLPKIQALSFSLATLTVVIMAILFYFRRDLVNRISLRLQCGIALIDATNHLTSLFVFTAPEGTWCTFIGFWRVFGLQIYCFLNMAIALNLQLVFLQNKTFQPKWELFYWVLPVFISLCCGVPPYALGIYGKDESKLCGFKKDHPHSILLNSLLVGLPKLITVVYCILISILVIFRLRRNINVVLANSHRKNAKDLGNGVDLPKFLEKLIIRVSLYPIACVIVLSGSIVHNLLKLANIEVFEITFWAGLGNVFIGTFNFLAFLMDPTFHIALQEAYRSLRQRFKNKNGQFENIEMDANREEGSNRDSDVTKVGHNENLVDQTKEF